MASLTSTITLYLSAAPLPSAEAPRPPAARAAECRHEPGPFVQIKPQQFVRINGFTFFDTIAADKWRRLALGRFCRWVIRMALTGAAEGVSKAQEAGGRGSGAGCVELKLVFDEMTGLPGKWGEF